MYEQSTSLKPVADKLNLTVQQSPWIQKGVAHDRRRSTIRSCRRRSSRTATIKDKRNTSAVEIAPNVLVAAHVLEHKPAELRAFDTVKADIERSACSARRR